MPSSARSAHPPGASAGRPRSRASACVELPASVPGRDWEIAPADKYTRWFEYTDAVALDRWIRSPAAPSAERIEALVRWLARFPNRHVLGDDRTQPPKYHPVGEFLRARLTDPVFRTLPLAERVWLALAGTGWLGEPDSPKGVIDFVRHAELPLETLPQVVAEALSYVPRAREYLCDVFHSRAESTHDAAERLALYGCIHRLKSVR
jgi:hypothetical protein